MMFFKNLQVRHCLSPVGSILSFLDKVVGFVPKHLWALIVFLGLFIRGMDNAESIKASTPHRKVHTASVHVFDCAF